MTKDEAGDRMSCPVSGAHQYERDGDKFICIKCKHIASYRPVPNQASLLADNDMLRELLTEIFDSIQKILDK